MALLTDYGKITAPKWVLGSSATLSGAAYPPRNACDSASKPMSPGRSSRAFRLCDQAPFQCPMHPTAKFLRITVPFPAKDHGTFVSATRMLRRLMGKKAPTTLTLIQRNLTGRDPEGIADDYLDFIGWSGDAASRPASSARKPSAARPRRRLATPLRLVPPRVRVTLASDRN
jgi:hypothetical protein